MQFSLRRTINIGAKHGTKDDSLFTFCVIELVLESRNFDLLLQGVIHEDGGVMDDQQSTNTVVHFLYEVPEALDRIRDHLRAFARTRLLDDQEYCMVNCMIILLVNPSLPLLQTGAVRKRILSYFRF